MCFNELTLQTMFVSLCVEFYFAWKFTICQKNSELPNWKNVWLLYIDVILK